MTGTTTASAPAPIVLAGDLPEGRGSYVQFWGDVAVAGMQKKECLVSVDIKPVGVALSIHPETPAAWVPDALAAYEGARRGALPTPTHTVEWLFSAPLFLAVDQ